jgi:hypothetical protein
MSAEVGGEEGSTGSRASDRLLARRERVLSLWEERVRREISAAAAESHPVLIDTLPAVIRQLAEALSPHHPRRTATEGSSVAEEHGGERVRETCFRLEDVIAEYRLLREVVFEVLEEDQPVTNKERGTTFTIDIPRDARPFQRDAESHPLQQ